jgi:MFS family permease
MLVPLAHGAGLIAIALLLGQQVVGDGAMTAYEIHTQTLRQQLTPAPLLGRVQGTLRVGRLGALLAGTLAAGVLADRIGMRSTLVLGAGGRFVAAALLALSPVRGWMEAGNSSRTADAATEA